ncbi:hypothetical protein BTHERMOSOX_637 [Bathymodiolus thermophilus thioautotrophic gill symbiont]|uniref:Uncharacterized protein n=1 Tax=Bathymodiolus thermophilus thioautotrophic gill symbiont TaxID=2360 RepID=A0A3G3IN25_9GAMM|nr:hypothetical protein MS2017_1509 [Bathymodiolus thermophilus thioautotrophic gill symbiont]CAB5505440.1 hypothetical protein THERMOS_2126 [Bathymodiolus thermophilus thioautotrophic gill symbiont]SGZ73586.1 hypothetical protein BTHERMOSOX_637 [Bathymodiolus thermophilus thioautotrophic gill symbiont]
MMNNFYFFSESYTIFKNKLSNLAPILIPSIGSKLVQFFTANIWVIISIILFILFFEKWR